MVPARYHAVWLSFSDARDIGGEEVGAVAVQVPRGSVVMLGGARVGVPSEGLSVAERIAACLTRSFAGSCADAVPARSRHPGAPGRVGQPGRSRDGVYVGDQGYESPDPDDAQQGAGGPCRARPGALGDLG
jgi:hypothetical protein